MDGIHNARITSTMLGFEDHGIFTAFVFVSADGASQGFGGRFLTGDYTEKFITGVLRAVGVESWEELRGKYVRVDRQGGLLRRIGHILEDRWYDPADGA
jgi:hypothetical protein